MRNLSPSDYYTATVNSFGQRKVRKTDLKHHKADSLLGFISTVALTEVRDANKNLICDHFWADVADGFASCHLDDRVKFTGRVMRYIKGCYAPDFHPGNEMAVDCKIGDIGNVEILSRTI